MIDDVLYDVVPPGHSEHNYTVRLFLKPSALTAPAIMLKGRGPSYLAAHSLNDIAEMLRKFLYRRYPIIWRETKAEDFDGSLYELVSADCRSALVAALENSAIFRPRIDYTAFPITPLAVKADFDCENFSLIDVHSLTEGSADWLNEKYLGTKEVGGWVVVKAASVEAAKRDRRVVLGALALAMDQQHRHGFTLREVVTGYLRFPAPQSISTSTSGPHTPPIGSSITIENADHNWLGKLPAILARSSPLTKRHGKALEYYYRAWFMDESDRCFLLFMALNAIFGQNGPSFAVGMKSGIAETLNENIEEKRLDALLRIRNTMLHGGAPDLFASSNYLEYAQKYSSDPSTDVQLLVAKCLRRHIFGDEFRCQDNPDTEALEFARVQGLIPSESDSCSIVSEWP
ncbi:hypothetical protein JL39_25830 [Rhizobium sp. YS-1r]|nr:hypothetical protein JL39_25830 [Rhizobium sp. YS-1r]